MKKNIAVLLSASLVTLLLSGCGSSYVSYDSLTAQDDQDQTGGNTDDTDGSDDDETAAADDDDTSDGTWEDDGGTVSGGDDTSGGTSDVADTYPPSGSISSVVNKDRLFGTVKLTAQVTDSGNGASGVAMVEYLYNKKVIGHSTDAASGFAVDFDTTKQSNGSQSLEMIVTDNAGNESAKIGKITVSIANYSTKWVETKNFKNRTDWNHAEAPQGAYVTGLMIKAGSVVDSFRATYTIAYGSKPRGYASAYPGIGGSGGVSQPQANCPDGTAAIGFIGREGDVIDSLGLVCKSLQGSTTWIATGMRGGSGGKAFNYSDSHDLKVDGVKFRPIVCEEHRFLADIEVGIKNFNGAQVISGIRLGCR